MISADTGRPGAGKTYSVVGNVILPALRDGRSVVTNVPLNDDLLESEMLGPVLKIDYRESEEGDFFSRYPKGSVFVLDEAWKLWPSGLKDDKLPLHHKEFLAEHRHWSGGGFSTEIHLVVQDVSMLATFPRRLIDKTLIFTKHDAVGADRAYRVEIYSGAVSATRRGRRDCINELHGTYSADVYRYYKSQTKAEDDKPGIEKRVDKRATIWRNPVIRYGMPLSLAFIIFGGWWATVAFGNFFSSAEPAKPAAPVKSAPKEAAPAPKAPVGEPAKVERPAEPPKEPPKPGLDSTWRIASSVFARGMAFVQLSSKSGYKRVPFSSCKMENREVTCLVDGKLVTRYSGDLLPSLSQIGGEAAVRMEGVAAGEVQRLY